MSNQPKKPPVVLGGIDVSKDPIVGSVAKKYAGGIAERAAQQRADRPKMGNLAAADAAFKPGRDGPMTIGQVLQSQKVATEEGRAGGLSPQTIAGMQAIAKAATDSRTAKAEAPPPPKETKKMEEQKPTPQPEAPPPPTPAQKKENAKLNETLDTLDDYELERIMRGIQNDVINNTKERDHVNDPANKRLTEIDFAQGIAEGEFTQIVDVIPKTETRSGLKVHYRTITPMENQAIRLWIFQRVAEDPRLDKISGELYGLGLVVASVTQINTKQYPDHLKRTGQGVYSAEFDENAWAEKFKVFSRMPQPLIHAVGTHGQWFDLRVRALFTTDYAKNG